jgi:lipid II:glycine glycyltransferase (peptidoglycan interpeptide bridge formation enzyme)
MVAISITEWDAFISRFPNPHILQTSPWGQLKADFGWQLAHVASHDCGAQILIKRIFPGINFAYIPKGPVGPDWNQLWPIIDSVCRGKNCVFLKIEPDYWVSDDPKREGNNYNFSNNFVPSLHSIQPMRTLVVDLTGEESQILGRMKQKTRYNINLALKKNVIVKPQIELNAFYDLMKITGQRDEFGIHSLAYYQRAFDLFHAHDQCLLLMAEFEGTPISALIVFKVGNRAWYFYGGSSNLQRDKMPNYLLQWEALRWAKKQGCCEYDLWGVPDVDLDILEANFTSQSDGLWGVYRFKRGFGGELKRSVGPWDRIYNPFLYRLYSLWLKYRKVEG